MTIESSRKIARGALIVFLAMLFGKLLSYFYIIVVAKLGSSKYGLLTLGITIISLISSISILGLNMGVLRYVSYYKGKGDKSRVKGAILSSFKILIPLGIVLFLLLFIFSKQISVIVFHTEDLIPVLRLFSILIPFLLITDILLSIIKAFQKIEYSVGIKEFFEKFTKIALTLFLILIGYGLLGAVIAYVIASILSFFLLFYVIEKKMFSFFNKTIKPIFYGKALFWFSFPLLINSFIVLVLKWMDVLMIGYFRTVSEVGVYNIALQTAALMMMVPSALMALFMPVITELYGAKKVDDIRLICKRTSKWIFFTNLPIFLLLFLFSKPLLNIFFGEEYVVGSTALFILIFGYLIFSLSSINSDVLIMIKKTKVILWINMIGAILNIVLNYFLIPKYGINGGAIATSAVLILISILYYIMSYRLIKIQQFMLNYYKAIIAGLVSLLIIYLFVLPLFEINLFYLIINGIIYLIIYLIFIILLKGFEKEDIDIIKNILKKKFD